MLFVSFVSWDMVRIIFCVGSNNSGTMQDEEWLPMSPPDLKHLRVAPFILNKYLEALGVEL